MAKGDPEMGLTGLLAYIRTPILAIQGSDDQYGSARQIELIAEECYCPVETMLLPGCGIRRIARRRTCC